MTREEAINQLEINKEDDTYVIDDEAIDLAIKALEQEPSIDELRAEITALQNRCYALTNGVMCVFCNYECQYKEKREGEK